MIPALLLLLAGMGASVPAKAETGSGPDPVRLIDFRIQDQMGKLHTSGYYRESVFVVVSGDRRGTDFIEEWLPVLADSLAAEIKSYRVKMVQHAHLQGAPFFVKGVIRKKFAENPGQRVLLDWDGDFDQAYDLAEDSCSILVFDPRGIRRMQTAVQEFDPKECAGILAGIRALGE